MELFSLKDRGEHGVFISSNVCQDPHSSWASKCLPKT